MGRDRERDEFSRDDGPSRADEASSWGANKKSLPAATGGGYQASGGREDRMGRGGYDDDTREVLTMPLFMDCICVSVVDQERSLLLRI
jgi:hypothetical protein